MLLKEGKKRYIANWGLNPEAQMPRTHALYTNTAAGRDVGACVRKPCGTSTPLLVRGSPGPSACKIDAETTVLELVLQRLSRCPGAKGEETECLSQCQNCFPKADSEKDIGCSLSIAALSEEERRAM